MNNIDEPLRYVHDKYGNRDMQEAFFEALTVGTAPKELWEAIEKRYTNER